VTELAGVVDDGSLELLSGWGRTAPTQAWVVTVDSPEAAVAVLAAPHRRGVVARGLGRSYGDAAQNAGGEVVRLGGDGTLALEDGGVLRVGGGVSFDRIISELLPRGWFVPVTPGTRHVTVGGAVAADVHGKNHHRDGTLTAHVLEIELATPCGLQRLRPGDPLFSATAGGMGLTGIVTEVRLQLLAVPTAAMVVDTDRTPDLDATLALMAGGDDDAYRYSVAWIDCLSPGAALGRAVVHRGDHAPVAAIPTKAAADPLRFRPRPPLPTPPWAPSGLLNLATIRAFNEVWYRRSPRRERGALQPLGGFFHPLDGVKGWNRLYGRKGFLQYQLVLPMGAEEVLRRVVERLAADRCPSFLGVLKRFGPGGGGHLSFPAAGWTLALDLPVGAARLGRVLDELDGWVAEAGGRVYLAKDARLRPELVEAMYPRLSEWREVRAGVDPAGVLRSDLARRLGLLEAVAG
jgi:decaprenylphospho-beta-D-ribofuranose 2-oxidase